jgi:hypothetical protein
MHKSVLIILEFVVIASAVITNWHLVMLSDNVIYDCAAISSQIIGTTGQITALQSKNPIQKNKA